MHLVDHLPFQVAYHAGDQHVRFDHDILVMVPSVVVRDDGCCMANGVRREKFRIHFSIVMVLGLAFALFLAIDRVFDNQSTQNHHGDNYCLRALE